MIPVYICDDEQSVRQKIAKILSEQIMILDQDLEVKDVFFRGKLVRG